VFSKIVCEVAEGKHSEYATTVGFSPMSPVSCRCLRCRRPVARTELMCKASRRLPGGFA
jgi:hypothetical protein